LSAEPGNLLNKHSYKFSGLANRKLVHVAATGKDKKPHLTIMKARTASSHMHRTVTPLLKHRRDRAIRAAHVINNATARSFHRPDLTKFAIARYHALHRASGVKEGTGVNAKRRRVGAKARKAAKPAAA